LLQKYFKLNVPINNKIAESLKNYFVAGISGRLTVFLDTVTYQPLSEENFN